MEYLVGVLLALGVAALSGLDRDRAFYPTVPIVIAAYSVLFAAMGASTGILGIETAVAAGFLVLAVFGFKTSMWLVAAAIAGHGVFDTVHHLFIPESGRPRLVARHLRDRRYSLGRLVGVPPPEDGGPSV